MHLSKWLTTLFIVTLTYSMALCQDVYRKKVVSYVPTVLAQRGCGLQKPNEDYICSTIGSGIDLPRFHFVELPEPVVRNFVAAVSGLPAVSVNSARPIIERTLAPDLLRILNIKKELLSKENLTEDERNTFLATKARAAGLTYQELMTVLNSGYICIPYVEFYKHIIVHKVREIKNDKGQVIGRVPYTIYTHQIELGLLWYKLNVNGSNATSISFIAAAKGWQNKPIERTAQQDDNSGGNADWFAFKDAVNVSMINVTEQTKRINEFRLVGDVEDITTFGLKFNLGTREGVGLDDSYWVEEMQQTRSGTIDEVKRGFVKVRDVANNVADPTAESYAQVITGTNYSQGLTVREIPLLGTNGVIGFEKIPITLLPFSNYKPNVDSGFGGLSNRDIAIGINSKTNQAFGPSLDVQTDLANVTGVSELWLDAGGALGFMLVHGKFYLPQYDSFLNGVDSSASIGLSMTGYLHAGLLKKFYFRRFGLLFQGDLKYAFTSLSANKKVVNGDTVNISLTHGMFGVDGRVGLEIYLTPTLSIGGAAEYSFVPWGNSWFVDVGGTKNKSATGPMIRNTGPGWLFWFNYSLPYLK